MRPNMHKFKDFFILPVFDIASLFYCVICVWNKQCTAARFLIYEDFKLTVFRILQIRCRTLYLKI